MMDVARDDNNNDIWTSPAMHGKYDFEILALHDEIVVIFMPTSVMTIACTCVQTIYNTPETR